MLTELGWTRPIPRHDRVPAAGDADIDMHYRADGIQHMILNGKDVTDADPADRRCPCTPPPVAAHPCGPGFPAGLAAEPGRASTTSSWTAGTSARWCCPMPRLKIYLTASAEDRAQRRWLELHGEGRPPVLWSRCCEDIQQRDYNDTHRDVAPPAPGRGRSAGGHHRAVTWRRAISCS